MSAAPAPVRHAPAALWRVAQAFLHMLHALFGAPEDVAAKHTFKRHAHAQLASWLRCAEAMLRRLLLIEASAFRPRPSFAVLSTGQGRACNMRTRASIQHFFPRFP